MAIPHTVEQIELPNGIRGLLIDTPNTPVVSYSLKFRSGPDKATRAYPFQVGHTLEHIVEAGPDDPKYPHKAEYLQEIMKNGAWRNAFTGEFGICYMAECVSEEALRILKLRLQGIENPKLKKTILKSESGNVLEEMRQRVSDYGRLVTALSRKTLSDGNWQTSKEAMAEAESVTLEQVKDYYTATHTAENLQFVVSGDMTHLRDGIIETFSASRIQKGKRLTGPVTRPSAIVDYRYEKRESLENIFTNYALAIPRELTAKEVATMAIVNNILCNTWNSRILGKARAKGLCYSMSGYMDALAKTQSIWMLSTPIGQPNAKAFFTLMKDALKDVSENGVTDEELQAAKAILTGQLKKNGQTTFALLEMYADSYFSLDKIVSTDDQIEGLENVSSHDIAALVHEFTTSESRVFSGVGSVEEEEFKAIYDVLNGAS